ncbi:hypothetical protein ATK17_1576 [Branchiibius hedensis]|uniref:Alpha/beta hydrolase n=1 Tax=Branchiibius hedensis TaxID=672460 RepID=A0A2Y8ZS37_9MICO|nr:hypothetical protein [Branchiibius hedensis]PWJ25453.1 hypothetical protein ATK17_1576 [Branchiibius hedensis]SSA34266.1 hypothetical protein SAMN04489750_1576 [Branchiibius hedensis]
MSDEDVSSAVVLVHGIGESGSTAQQLAQQWLPALQTGLRAAGASDLADELRVGPGDRGVEMAYYADVFAPYESAHAMALATDPDLTEPVAELTQQWLETAASRSSDPSDRETAEDALAFGATEESLWDRLRILSDALNDLHFFRPGVVDAASVVDRALREAALYSANAQVKTAVQQRIHTAIGAQTKVVVAHSLGSVAAYEVLHELNQPVALVTIGSPLGMSTVFYERLTVQPPHVPATETAWTNLADPDDLIATRLDLAPYFPGADVTCVSHQVDNGADPHDPVRYLQHAQTAEAVAAGLTDQ